MTVPDAAVEAAAKAIEGYLIGPIEMQREIARAAIEAAMPALCEADRHHWAEKVGELLEQTSALCAERDIARARLERVRVLCEQWDNRTSREVLAVLDGTP